VRTPFFLIEIFVHVFGKNGRREWAEALAVLDLEVERLLHRRRAGVAEDRAAAERARAELHAALEPADRLPLRQPVRAGGDQARGVERFEHRARLGELALDLLQAELRSQVAAAHGVLPCGNASWFFIK